ncbi:zinc finger, CCHC-type, Retrotransposon gag domain protein [Artemisia annua]|uniref:Zinc finger, CCHC-type, Retrotransposon gag domain protein n=1 Tax=Artemisia annua TaxID=35608 RepID=A0A2U1KUF7_ARTAN|nr:zinc finger, CCHC-type, Retrotransposon gag domain protein [Artemisia annua]
MVGVEVDKYTARFHELTRMVPHIVSTVEKLIDRYIWGLIPEIRRDVTSSEPTTLQDAVGMAYHLTNDVIRSGGLTKGNDNKQKRQGDQQGNRDQDQQDKRQRENSNLAVAVDGIDTNRGGNISPARGRAYFLSTKEAR